MEPNDRIEQLRITVERRENEVRELRKIYDRDDREPRDAWRLQRADQLANVAREELARAEEAVRISARQAEQELHQERWRKLREPPSLQQLVLDHGTYDKITQEAWIKFDADMAEWKQKMREGYFDHVMDRPKTIPGSTLSKRRS